MHIHKLLDYYNKITYSDLILWLFWSDRPFFIEVTVVIQQRHLF